MVLEVAGGEVDRLLDQCHHCKHSWQKFPIHESRRPVLVAAMICNVQRGLRLGRGLFVAWSGAAEQQVLHSLQRTKLVRSKQAAPLALASPPPATWLHASRLFLINTVPRLVHSCSLCHPFGGCTTDSTCILVEEAQGCVETTPSHVFTPSMGG